MKLKPTPKENRCTECGEEGLTLAEEFTKYFSLKCDEMGHWQKRYLLNEEPGSENEVSVRLLCAECGTYYQVPNEL